MGEVQRCATNQLPIKARCVGRVGTVSRMEGGSVRRVSDHHHLINALFAHFDLWTLLYRIQITPRDSIKYSQFAWGTEHTTQHQDV